MEGATEGTGGRTEVGVVVTAAGTPVTPSTLPPMGTSAAAEAEAPPVVGAVVTFPGTLAAAALPAGVGFRTEAAAAADCAAPAGAPPGSPPGGRPGSFAETAPFFRTIARPGNGPSEGRGEVEVRLVVLMRVGEDSGAPVLTSDGGVSVGAGAAGSWSGGRAASTAARSTPLPQTSTGTDRTPPSCEREGVQVRTGRLAGAAENAGALGA